MAHFLLFNRTLLIVLHGAFILVLCCTFCTIFHFTSQLSSVFALLKYDFLLRFGSITLYPAHPDLLNTNPTEKTITFFISSQNNLFDQKISKQGEM